MTQPTTEPGVAMLLDQEDVRAKLREWIYGDDWWVFFIHPDYIGVTAEIEERCYMGEHSLDSELLMGSFPFWPYPICNVMAFKKRSMTAGQLAEIMAGCGANDSVGDLAAMLSDHDLLPLVPPDWMPFAPLICMAAEKWVGSRTTKPE